jgi:dCTP deaminase
MAGPLADWQIVERIDRVKYTPNEVFGRDEITDPYRLCISPFIPQQVKKLREEDYPPEVWRKVSCRLNPAKVGSGLSGFGYDLRLHNLFRFLKRDEFDEAGKRLVLDPLGEREEREACFHPVETRDTNFLLEPGTCVLAESVERFRIPEDCQALVIIKSTWARCFLDLNTTPLEPGWIGTVTLEIVNHATLPIRIRPWEGIGQVVFYAGDGPCKVPYHKAGGAYQNQSGPTIPLGCGVRVHPSTG